MTYTPHPARVSDISYRIVIRAPLGSGIEARLNMETGAPIYIEQLGEEELNVQEVAAARVAADVKFQELLDLINSSESFTVWGSKADSVGYDVSADEPE